MKKNILFSILLLSFISAFGQGIINKEMTTLELFLREKVLKQDVEAVPRFAPGLETGKASYYADKFQGLKTANGERYDTAGMTCAHLNYPFGTLLKVTSVSSQKSVVVKVNDRGPFVPTRVIDLAKKPARELGILRAGIAEVTVEPYYSGTTPPPTTLPPSPAPAPVTPEQTMGKGFFSIAEHKYPANGFGVQTGSYMDSKTLFFHIDILKQKGVSPLMVHSGFNASDQPTFRIIAGPYKTRKEATDKLADLKAMNIQGLVIDMKNLR